MTQAKIVTALWSLLCTLAAVGAEIVADPSGLAWLPPKVAHYVVLACMGAIWLKSHKNLFIDPTTGKLPDKDPQK